MMQLTCPLCGPRVENEFHCGGTTGIARPPLAGANGGRGHHTEGRGGTAIGLQPETGAFDTDAGVRVQRDGNGLHRRPVLLLSLLIMSLDYLNMAVAPTIWLLLAARIVAKRRKRRRNRHCAAGFSWHDPAGQHKGTQPHAAFAKAARPRSAPPCQ